MAILVSCCVTIDCASAIVGGTSDCEVPTLAVTCPGTTEGTVGTVFSSSMSASGGTAPYTYAIGAGALPTGLSLNASTGAITGTPSTAGTFGFQVQVTDVNGVMGFVDCAIAVSPAPTTAGGFLLTEEGGYLLLETGGRILLDPVGTKPSIGGVS